MKPQPKTVRAWAFVWRSLGGQSHVVSFATRRNALDVRGTYSHTVAVGPVVRIEVPAPKERR